MIGALRRAPASTLLLHIFANEVYFTFIYIYIRVNRKVDPTGGTSGIIAINVGRTKGSEMETRDETRMARGRKKYKGCGDAKRRR